MPRSQFICVWLGSFWNRSGIQHRVRAPSSLFPLYPLSFFQHPSSIIRARCFFTFDQFESSSRCMILSTPRLVVWQIFELGSTIIWARRSEGRYTEYVAMHTTAVTIKFGTYPRFWRYWTFEKWDKHAMNSETLQIHLLFHVVFLSPLKFFLTFTLWKTLVCYFPISSVIKMI